LQPSTDRKTIEGRLEVVEKLTNDRTFYDRTRQIIKEFHGFDDMISFCYNLQQKHNDTFKSAEVKINNIMLMNQILHNVNVLKETLKESGISMIENFYQVAYFICVLKIEIFFFSMACFIKTKRNFFVMKNSKRSKKK
jgi:hypothetical protein